MRQSRVWLAFANVLLLNSSDSVFVKGAVTDEDGLYYEWNDKSLPGTANINAVKAASLTTLTGTQKQTPAPVKTTDELDGIIGTTVGE